jgi:hypothetical protein
MARRKRHIKGVVYYTNDTALVNSKPKSRMVVSVNNDPQNMHVRRVLTANKGKNSANGIPIERYPNIRKESVVERRVFKKTRSSQPIQAKKMKKSKTRLNKWDRKKIGIK